MNTSSRPPATAPPLIAEYSNGFRRVEIGSIGLFAGLVAALALRGYVSGVSPFSVQVVGIAVLGALGADLVSGLVHWAADTWGDQTWPIVGPTLIRSFREHHVDEKAITRHDFVEANGASALVLLPLLVVVHLLLPADSSTWTPVHQHAAVFALSLALCVLMTNQVHKWAHQDQPPALVRMLQQLRLVLRAQHHQRHHIGDHLSHYCITTGWLNPLMDRSGFFRMSERVIQAVSPLRAREDDVKLLGEAAGDRQPHH